MNLRNDEFKKPNNMRETFKKINESLKQRIIENKIKQSNQICLIDNMLFLFDNQIKELDKFVINADKILAIQDQILKLKKDIDALKKSECLILKSTEIKSTKRLKKINKELDSDSDDLNDLVDFDNTKKL